MLIKIENLDKGSYKKLLIKEYYQRNYQNEEMQRKDIYNIKLDKLLRIHVIFNFILKLIIRNRATYVIC